MQSQRGITLIELLVALLIGLFMVAGILQVFVGSRQSLDVIRAQSSMQETARFGINFIATATRQAGYLNAGPMTYGNVFASQLAAKVQTASFAEDMAPFEDEIWPADGDFAALAVISGENNFNGSVGGVDVADNTDVLRIRLQGDPDGFVNDCEGSPLATDPDLYINMSFFVGDDEQLYCRVFDGAANRAPVALVSGIENMQVLYGVATDPNDRFTVTQYVHANNVADWSQVMTVRFAILAVSDDTALEIDDQDAEYALLDEEQISVDAGDTGKARQVFSQTVALRGNLSNSSSSNN